MSAPAFKVTTHHLAPDGRAADAAFGDQGPVEMDAAALTALCAGLRDLDLVQNHTHEPHFAVQGPRGRFLVRMDLHRLFAYDPRDSSRPAIEVDAPALVDLLAGAPAATAVTDEAAGWTPVEDRAARRKTMAGAALLAVALGLNATAAFLWLRPAERDPALPFEPITDPAAAALHVDRLAGVFATGTAPGEHRIVIHRDGRLDLQDIAADGSVETVATERFVVGRHAGALCLMIGGATSRVEIRSDRTLVCYGDTYERMSP